MTKFMINDFNHDVFMGVASNFCLIAKVDHSSTETHRSDIIFETEYTKNIINVEDEKIRVKVNGCDRTIDEACERIFANTDDVKSIALMARKEGYLDIMVLMSR